MIRHKGFVNLRAYKKTKNGEGMRKKSKEEYTLDDRLKDSEDFIMHCARQMESEKKNDNR